MNPLYVSWRKTLLMMKKRDYKHFIQSISRTTSSVSKYISWKCVSYGLKLLYKTDLMAWTQTSTEMSKKSFCARTSCAVLQKCDLQAIFVVVHHTGHNWAHGCLLWFFIQQLGASLFQWRWSRQVHCASIWQGLCVLMMVLRISIAVW